MQDCSNSIANALEVLQSRTAKPSSYYVRGWSQDNPLVSLTDTSPHNDKALCHYCDVIMGAMASQITSLPVVYSTVYSGADQRKHQSSASLTFVRGIHRWPVNSAHKWPVTRQMFSFDNVIMAQNFLHSRGHTMTKTPIHCKHTSMLPSMVFWDTRHYYKALKSYGFSKIWKITPMDVILVSALDHWPHRDVGIIFKSVFFH